MRPKNIQEGVAVGPFKKALLPLNNIVPGMSEFERLRIKQLR
jgi:hypothetical protein